MFHFFTESFYQEEKQSGEESFDEDETPADNVDEKAGEEEEPSAETKYVGYLICDVVYLLVF